MASANNPDRPKWTPGTQPRDPIGRFRKTNLVPGWYEYERGGEIHHYYINDLKQMSDGMRSLEMGARAVNGNQFDKLDETAAIERVHMVASMDDELMYVSADRGRICGVIQHDTVAPPEPFSMSRLNLEARPVSDNLPADETAFGGRPAKLSGRPDGRTYDMLAAQEGEALNRKAFENPMAHTCEMEPRELAEKAIEARHWYQERIVKPKRDKSGNVVKDMKGNVVYRPLRADEARELPVYAYVDGKTGEFKVIPAMRVSKDGTEVFDKGYPNTRGGGAVVKLTGGDITRMSRALEADNVGKTAFTITSGSNLSKTGKPLNNALHYRTEVTNDRTGRSSTVWGTVENEQKGAKIVEAQNRYIKPDGTIDATKIMTDRKKNLQLRVERAKPHMNPKDSTQASALLHHRHGGYYAPEDIQLENGTLRLKERHRTTIFDQSGEIVGREYDDIKGFANMFNSGRAPGDRVSESRISQTEDGGFTIRAKRGTDIVARYSRSGERL